MKIIHALRLTDQLIDPDIIAGDRMDSIIEAMVRLDSCEDPSVEDCEALITETATRVFMRWVKTTAACKESDSPAFSVLESFLPAYYRFMNGVTEIWNQCHDCTPTDYAKEKKNRRF